ncbi:unnamed protein product, partial [Vitis vinifera]|uniref:Uncharacterized protein n=1 Tax=Vitis vinifera TaxID=29760 RepID=D7TPU7_VITVI
MMANSLVVILTPSLRALARTLYELAMTQQLSLLHGPSLFY